MTRDGDTTLANERLQTLLCRVRTLQHRVRTMQAREREVMTDAAITGHFAGYREALQQYRLLLFEGLTPQAAYTQLYRQHLVVLDRRAEGGNR